MTNRYPLGFDAPKICQFAKILSVADVYDALVTKRPYKDAFQRDAVEMLMSMTNQLDIGVMRAFMSSMILYPVDSIVQLSNGEKARVVKTASTTFFDQLLSASIPQSIQSGQ
ncbi:MAG: HD-GYP domain-containing protein [Agathobacter rectalis]